MPEDLTEWDKISRPVGNVEGHKACQSLELKCPGKAGERSHRLGKLRVKGTGQKETLVEFFSMCLLLISSVHPPVS